MSSATYSDHALFVVFDCVAAPTPHLPPSIRVQSAHGQHWYWRVGGAA